MNSLFKSLDFDYRLGYVRTGCELPGFDVLKGLEIPCKKIVTLGGYTTPEQGADKASWANYLHEQLEGKAQIYNGDTDGYTSAQALIMFIRDGILLRPDMVICLSGFYNFAYRLGLVQDKSKAETLKSYPFSTSYHIELYGEMCSRFGLGNQGVYYGMETSEAAWELWLTHMEMLHCLCNEFNIQFMAFLQPCIFSGEYRRSERENLFLEQSFALTREAVDRFRGMFKEQYQEVTKRIGDLGYITDISGLFDDDEDVYMDACHVREKYVRRLSSEIHLSLKNLGIATHGRI